MPPRAGRLQLTACLAVLGLGLYGHVPHPPHTGDIPSILSFLSVPAAQGHQNIEQLVICTAIPPPQVSGPDDGCLLSSFLRGRVPLLLAWHLDPGPAVSGWKEQRPLLAGGCQRQDPSCTRAGPRQ